MMDKDYFTNQKELWYFLQNLAFIVLYFTDYFWVSYLYIVGLLLLKSHKRYKNHIRRKRKRIDREKAKERGEYLEPLEAQDKEKAANSIEMKKYEILQSNFLSFFIFYFFSNQNEFSATTIENKTVYYNKRKERLFLEWFVTLSVCTFVGVAIYHLESDLVLQKIWYTLNILLCALLHVFYIWKMKVQIK